MICIDLCSASSVISLVSQHLRILSPNLTKRERKAFFFELCFLLDCLSSKFPSTCFASLFLLLISFRFAECYSQMAPNALKTSKIIAKIPKYLLHAAQMPPRCVPEPSKCLPKTSQMHPKCLPNGSQMASRGDLHEKLKK